LIQLHQAGRLAFFGSAAHLTEWRAFLRYLSPVRKKRWVVYAKAPFVGPQAVLAYLSRYTYRVAISNRRLLTFDARGVTFRYKDYERDRPERQRVITLATDEFIRRFLLHIAPNPPPDEEEPPDHRLPCPCCGGPMVVVETFVRWQQPRAPPTTLALAREIAP